MQLPFLTGQQADLLAIFTFDPTGYIDEVKLTYMELFEQTDVEFEKVFNELIDLNALTSDDGEFFNVSLVGLASLVATERKEGVSRTFHVSRYYRELDSTSYADVVLYMVGGWYDLSDLSPAAMGVLSALCGSHYIWPLLSQFDNYKQRELVMFSWFNMALWRPSADSVTQAIAVLEKMPTASSLPYKGDYGLLGAKPLPNNDPFLLPYSTQSLSQIWPQSRLNNPQANFNTLLDLAALSIYYPEKIDPLSDKLVGKVKRAGFTEETSACWYHAFAMATSSAEQIELQLGTADQWLAMLAMPEQVGWGAALLELLTIFRLFSLKPQLHQQVLPALKQSSQIKVALNSDNDFPLAQKVKLGLTQLLNPQEQLFYVPVDQVGKWFEQLNQVIEGESLASERLVWQLDKNFSGIEVKVQKLNKKGWSKGRAVNLRELDWKYKELLDETDRQIIRELEASHYYWHDLSVTLPVARLLAESERVIDVDGESVTIYPEKPLLLVHQESEHPKLTVYPQLHSEEGIVEKQGGILAFLDRSEKLKHFFEVFERFPEGVPLSELPALEAALHSIPNLCWYSDFSNSGSVECKPWSEKPALWLSWRELSMEVAIEHGPEDSDFAQLCQPSGQGEEWISMHSNPKFWFRRDLKAEQKSAKAVAKELELPNRKQPRWELDFQDALALLDRLPSVQDLEIHWRGGQKVNVLSESSLKLEVTQKEKWFKVEGVAAVDKELELELRTLLANSHANYQRLEDGSVLLITESLKRQLRLLDSVLDEEHQVDSRMAYPLAQLIDSMSHQGDQGWQTLTDKWREKPVLDASHLVQLRDYQKESVQWAAHLAHHQFGACLADDMGLGKTIQALTLLRHFAPQGPALVVAPKSVVHNWQLEAERFAPELKMLVLEGSKEGVELINNAGAADVVLLSYGLLTRLAEPLQEKEWQSVVLDEAQNIKNPATKRANLLFKLQAKCRFALTGTPIENHLLELWSLFNFINPGLLGAKAQFVKTYGKASKNEEDMARLKTLVSPFIMRRLKSQVLKELPPKTEITHEIALSKPERTAYEAIRKQVLAEAKLGKGLVEVLSGLTKLRQVCCDPRLVFDSIKEPGSKLLEARNLVQEALENGHKILVFSQFVKVLKGFAELLKEQKVGYCYLDGQTTGKQRKKAVTDFKEGKHPLFLISLKAGGTGLNLTEADMVIHLDPWWNPAVEDQASDRAHRMGQTKPVTVYRLVAEDSIEQKIIKLHEEKRELADKLLDGESSSKALSPDVLVGLLSQGV